ncbi:hypothetical protein, partial [Prescottella equi]|uniref:hypothetical protein n=1 Tax=Rhodococcus hoagii TaxID=43767 RepID=UPI001C92F017
LKGGVTGGFGRGNVELRDGGVDMGVGGGVWKGEGEGRGGELEGVGVVGDEGVEMEDVEEGVEDGGEQGGEEDGD